MPEARRQRIRTIAGVVVSVLIGSLALWVLYRTFQQISIVDVLARMRAMPRDTLLLAALCAATAVFTSSGSRSELHTMRIGPSMASSSSPATSNKLDLK